MKVRFKFRRHVPEDEQVELLGSLGRQGAQNVRRLFPADHDQDLSALYTLDTEGRAAAEPLLKFLNNSPAIEFAETDPPRGLIE